MGGIPNPRPHPGTEAMLLQFASKRSWPLPEEEWWPGAALIHRVVRCTCEPAQPPPASLARRALIRSMDARSSQAPMKLLPNLTAATAVSYLPARMGSATT